MLISRIFFICLYKQNRKQMKIKVGQNNVLTIKEKKKNGVIRISVHSTVFEDEPIYDQHTLDSDYSEFIINNLKLL